MTDSVLETTSRPAAHTAPEHHTLPSWKSLAMWGAATILYCYQFFLRSSPQVIVDDLMREFTVDAESLGVLTSFYYIAYASLQVPMGILLDKIGLRRILTFSAVLCAGGTYIFAISQDLLTAQIGRLMIGAGSAAVFLSCLKIITLWLPRRRFGIFLGLSMMVGTIGAISSGGPLALLVGELGWRAALMSISFFGLIWAMLIYIIVRDRKAPVGQKIDLAPVGLLEGLRQIVWNRQIWLAAFYGTTMYAVLSGFADLWGTPYLMQAYDLERPSAANTSLTVYIGLAIGGPFFGYISERFQTRKMPMLLSAIGGLVFFSLFLSAREWSLPMVSFCLFAVGFFVGGKLMNFAVATDSVPASLSGTATGFINACCMTSGVIFQPLIGRLMCYNWNGAIVDGVPQYAVSDYCFAFASIPVCMLIAIGLTLMTRESYPKKS